MKRTLLAAVLLATAISAGAQQAVTPNMILKGARKLFDAGQYAAAIHDYARILAEHPSSPEASVAAYFTGLAKERSGQRQAAIESYREMISKYGGSSDLAKSAQQRIRELEADIKRNPEGTPPSAPAQTPVGSGAHRPIEELTNTLDTIIDRSVKPDGTHPHHALPPRQTKPQIVPVHRNTETSWPTQVEQSASWPQEGAAPATTNAGSSSEEIYPDAFLRASEAAQSGAPSDVDVIDFSSSAKGGEPEAPPSGGGVEPSRGANVTMEEAASPASSSEPSSTASMPTMVPAVPHTGSMYGMRVTYVRRPRPPAAAASMGQHEEVPAPSIAAAPTAPPVAPQNAATPVPPVAPQQVSALAPVESTAPQGGPAPFVPAPAPAPDLRMVPPPAAVIAGEMIDPYRMQRNARIVVPPAASILRSDAFAPAVHAAPPADEERKKFEPAPAVETAPPPVVEKETHAAEVVAPAPSVPQVAPAVSPLPSTPAKPAVEAETMPLPSTPAKPAVEAETMPLPSTPAKPAVEAETMPLPSIWESTLSAGGASPASPSARRPASQSGTTGLEPSAPALPSSRTPVVEPVPTSLSGELFSPLPPPVEGPRGAATSMEPAIVPPSGAAASSAPPSHPIEPIAVAPREYDHREAPATGAIPTAPSPPAAAVPAQGNDTNLPAPVYGISIDAARRAIVNDASAFTAPQSRAAATAPSSAPRAPQSGAAAPAPAGPADASIRKAIELRKLGYVDQAIEEYKKALELDPDNPIAKNNLSDIWVERGENIEKAIQMLKEALTLDLPDKGPFYSTLGWAYAKLGDYENGEKFLNEAIRIRVTASRLYRRGRLYAAMGMASRARADLDRALVYSEDLATTEMIRKAIESIGAELPLQGAAPGIR